MNYGAVAIGRVECRVSEHVFLITNMLIPQYNCNVGVTTIAICVGIMDAPWPLLSLRFVLELRCYVSPWASSKQCKVCWRNVTRISKGGRVKSLPRSPMPATWRGDEARIRSSSHNDWDKSGDFPLFARNALPWLSRHRNDGSSLLRRRSLCPLQPRSSLPTNIPFRCIVWGGRNDGHKERLRRSLRWFYNPNKQSRRFKARRK